MDEEPKINGPVENHKSSRFPGFYHLNVAKRLEALSSWFPLSMEEKWILRKETLTAEKADMMIENVIGVFGMPLGLAVNFKINDRDFIIPMAVEETSVVAAASNSAKLIRENGFLVTSSTPAIMEGQIQIVNIPDLEKACAAIDEAKDRLLRLANKHDPMLVSLGGGVKDIYHRKLETQSGPMLIVHIAVDVIDAMGANAVNTMSEALGPVLCEMTGGDTICQIISNLCDKSLVSARFEVNVGCVAKAGYSGKEVAERIVKAYHFADADPYRAATHNKGVMNGIDAVLIATGNDWRAVEAAAHAFAAKSGRYRPLTSYRLDGDKLIGEIEIPLAVGLVGGVTKLHTGVEILFKLMGVSSRRELAEIIAAAGLVQNFSAIRTLATEGIQQGHMSLHARNVAYSAGAFGSMAIEVANQMSREGRIRFDRAKEIIKNLIEQKKGKEE